MERPIIGILPLYDEEKESYWMLPGYMKGIEDAGGIPFMLPLNSDAEIIEKIADECDGFLFTGGQDVNPGIYNEKMEDFCGQLCSERDEMETALFQRAIELDKPVLGICRGLQVMNVLLGGTLYQDIPAQLDSKVEHRQAPPYAEPVHNVYIEKGTLLYDILQRERYKVNSCHHQGIKGLSNQLSAVAKAEDGLIEAVILPQKKFVLAVQWHPEFNYKTDKGNFRLFERFIKACATR